MISEKKGESFIRRRAAEVRTHRILRKIIPAILATIVVLMVLIYVISVMYTKFGSFTVSVNKYHVLQYGLSLSEDRYFSSPTARLDCKAAKRSPTSTALCSTKSILARSTGTTAATIIFVTPSIAKIRARRRCRTTIPSISPT